MGPRTQRDCCIHLQDPAHWVELDGKTVVRKVWGGRANLAEYDADGSGSHVTLLALRWFNQTTGEWNLDFATPQVGILGAPGVGTFKDGRAEFYGFDTIAGRIFSRRKIFDLEDHRRYSTIRAGLFRRWRQDLGSELD